MPPDATPSVPEMVERERHEPEMEKQPAAISRPRAKVEVALVPERLRYVPVKPPVNVVVAGEPKVAAPVVPLKATAAVVEVAEYEDVAIKRLLEMERIVHASLPSVVSTSESCGLVAFAAVSAHCGEVVPIPTLPEESMVMRNVGAVVVLPSAGIVANRRSPDAFVIAHGFELLESRKAMALFLVPPIVRFAPRFEELHCGPV